MALFPITSLVFCRTELFPFPKNDEVWDFLLALPSIPEDRLDELSHKAEARQHK